MRLLLTSTLLLSVLQEKQDDLSKWIGKLGAESIEERDAAARHLESLDPAAAETLEAWKTDDAEIRARLDSIAKTLRVRASLARVFGTTRRATLAMKGATLESVAAALGKALDEKIELVGFDPSAKVSLTLSNAPLWDSLSALADAVEGHIGYWANGVKLSKGKRGTLPSKTMEQFQVSVVQATRLETWTPSSDAAPAAMICVALRYQRNLKPTRSDFNNELKITTVTDAKGNKAVARRPAWGESLMVASRPFAFTDVVFVAPDAVLPLTVAGSVNVPFAIEEKTVEMAVAKAGETTEEGDYSFEVRGFTSTEAGVRFALRIKGPDSEEIGWRFQKDDVIVVAKDGSESRVGWSGGSDTHYRFEGAAKVVDPVGIKFRWTTKFHRVQFDWTLENVRLP